MIVLIDNYDSFTFNLVHLLNETGNEAVVWRNDKFDLVLAVPSPDATATATHAACPAAAPKQRLKKSLCCWASASVQPRPDVSNP